ncbi:uncharacterized protein EV420DRAFT_1473558 [Desarmillaria tabescens]|uniref:Uncharacterized protein n=1 Tax=Armillaria tabescens TaxID=1929756 RepID=A0AA39NL75_ARMTA|nr:uncharacterized protein EV420DRAFT_1473558 [Desarmillaria tabescens]KAK0467703.1 hypothetical protein EV420DRAFT_1473558 [Desarmillaria tabescens]
MGPDLASSTTLKPVLLSESALTEELPPPTSLPGGEMVAAVLHILTKVASQVDMVLQNPQNLQNPQPTMFPPQSDMVLQTPPDIQQPVQQPVQQTIFPSQSEAFFRNKQNFSINFTSAYQATESTDTSSTSWAGKTGGKRPLRGSGESPSKYITVAKHRDQDLHMEVLEKAHVEQLSREINSLHANNEGQERTIANNKAELEYMLTQLSKVMSTVKEQATDLCSQDEEITKKNEAINELQTKLQEELTNCQRKHLKYTQWYDTNATQGRQEIKNLKNELTNLQHQLADAKGRESDTTPLEAERLRLEGVLANTKAQHDTEMHRLRAATQADVASANAHMEGAERQARAAEEKAKQPPCLLHHEI